MRAWPFRFSAQATRRPVTERPTGLGGVFASWMVWCVSMLRAESSCPVWMTNPVGVGPDDAGASRSPDCAGLRTGAGVDEGDRFAAFWIGGADRCESSCGGEPAGRGRRLNLERGEEASCGVVDADSGSYVGGLAEAEGVQACAVGVDEVELRCVNEGWREVAPACEHDRAAVGATSWDASPART
jgi:hypothetical protein